MERSVWEQSISMLEKEVGMVKNPLTELQEKFSIIDLILFYVTLGLLILYK